MRKFETIVVEIAESVATVALNRPPLNVGGFEMFDELAEAFEALSGDDVVRSVLFTSRGEHFSAGLDLGDYEWATSGDAFTFMRRVNRTYVALERMPKPVVAAVRGYALGFGLESTLACDIVLASETAQFGLPEIRVGLLPAVTLTRGARLIGRRGISRLALTGDRIDARRAYEIGLCNQVVPDGDLDRVALDLARRLAAGPPLAMEVTRRMLHEQAAEDYDLIAGVMPGLLLSEDFKEGRIAFKEKRRPDFNGR